MATRNRPSVRSDPDARPAPGADARALLQARLTERHQATISHGSLADLDPPPGDPDPSATPASDALRWVRGE